MSTSESFDRGTATRLSQSFSSFTRKLSSFRNKEYNKVEDLYDTRIPLHNEDVFQHGLRFKAKYVGSLEIARPTCKVDIITAMRRIRYEYKVKGIRKTRVYMEMSTSGVRVSKRKSKRKRKQYSEEQLFVMSHPVYRIFYVSHDSQDLKIFSYITREVPNNTFRCNVFKAYKKKMALHIVRSLGQAFDVCHKLNPKPKKKKEETSASEDEKAPPTEDSEPAEGEGEVAKTPETWKQFNNDLEESVEKLSLDNKTEESGLNISAELGFDPFASPPPVGGEFPPPLGNGGLMDPFQSSFSDPVTHPPLAVGNSTSLPNFPEGVDPATINIPPVHMHLLTGPTGSQGQTIRENPFTDSQPFTGRTDSPVSIGESLDGGKGSNPFRPTEGGERDRLTSQISHLQEQLQAETTARIESQARVEQLLSQNKQLLSQLEKLMAQLTQIQFLQLSQATPTAAKGPSPPHSPELPSIDETPQIESAVTEPPPDLDTAVRQSPVATNDPFQPVESGSPVATNDPFQPVESGSPVATNDPFQPVESGSPVVTNDPFQPVESGSPVVTNDPFQPQTIDTTS